MFLPLRVSPRGLHILTPIYRFVNPIFAKKPNSYTFLLFSKKTLAFLFIFLYTDPVNRVDAHAYSAEGTGSCPLDEEIRFAVWVSHPAENCVLTSFLQEFCQKEVLLFI